MRRPPTHPAALARRARAVVAAGALALGACEPEPVAWTTLRAVGRVAGEANVALTAEGAVRPDSLAALARAVAPPPGPVCGGSLRLAWGGAALYAAWWAPRSDSGARLLAARSADRGATWSAAVPVDTTDRAVSGCRREPPSIASDATGENVHVSYALLAAEGPGLFYSHSMDRAGMFHAPVPIFYGERLGRTSVAADGDLVAVAFEDPNSATPRIGLALSVTMGHIFEHRLLPVSDDQGAATHPVTAVHGRHVAVAWQQRGVADTSAALLVRAGVVR